jgi:hypothetical protein
MLADEQAWSRFQQLEEQEIQAAIRMAIATVEPSDSDEHELADGEASDSEDDRRVRRRSQNIQPWTEELHDVHPPLCDAIPVVTLPPHRVVTELGFLECFIDTTLIDTFVANTNLYASARQAPAWVDTTTDEMWRYLAVLIRQGIVPLPDMHMYWAADYRDSYITALMTRDRFVQLHRTFTSLHRSLEANGRLSYRRLLTSIISVRGCSNSTTLPAKTSQWTDDDTVRRPLVLDNSHQSQANTCRL